MTHHGLRSSRSTLGILIIGGWLFIGGCSWVTKGAPDFDVGIRDRGVASWYGGQFHGKQTANGTVYDMQGLTAAHQWLPLGSMIRVVNLMNGKFLFVQVTDRGPYVNGRILDLSHGAAVRLGMEKGGLAIVQIEVVGERRPDALLPSDLMPAASRARIFRVDAEAARHRPRLLSPFRPFPGDLWTRRGMRRVPSMLAADHTAHAEVAALPLS